MTLSFFHTSFWCLRKVSSYWGFEKKCENKKIMSVFPVTPLGWQGLRLRLVELQTYIIFVSLTIDIHKRILIPSGLLTSGAVK